MKITPPVRAAAASILLATASLPVVGEERTAAWQPAADLPGQLYQRHGDEQTLGFGVCSGQYKLPTLTRDSALQAQSGDTWNAEMDHLQGAIDGPLTLEGNVQIRLGERSLNTQLARFNRLTGHFEFPQGVRLQQSDLVVQANTARFNVDAATAQLQAAQWVETESGLRGQALGLHLSKAGNLDVKNTELTLCPPGDNSWSVSAGSMQMDADASSMIVRRAIFKIRSVPVLYHPYLKIPLERNRRSGWLMPNVSQSNVSGVDLSLPYYINLAPNYDATIAARWVSKRGYGFEGQIRHLDQQSQTEANLGYLFDDEKHDGRLDRDVYDEVGGAAVLGEFVPADRWLIGLEHISRYNSSIGLISARADFTGVSDRNYFRDLDTYAGLASPNDLNQFAELALRSEQFQVSVVNRGFQRLDNLRIEAIDASPQIHARFIGRPQPSAINFDISAQWSRFDRAATELTGIDALVGERLHIEPNISFAQRGPWGFWQAQTGYRMSKYQLEDTLPGNPEPVQNLSPDRNIGFFALDAGLVFERSMSLGSGHYQQTLEPRLYYLRQGYENQEQLPVFDSADLDFTISQLFSNNRFSGLDRIGDANQATIGLSSSLINRATGRETLSIAAAHVHHFTAPKVFLPGVRQWGGDEVMASALSMRLANNWQIDANQLWNYERRDWDELGIFFRFKKDQHRLLNFGYRQHQRTSIKQAEVSLLWPISQHFAYTARWQYETDEHRTLEAYAGLEYDDCCFRARLMARQYLRRITFADLEQSDSDLIAWTSDRLRTDRGIVFEVTFKGLGSLGSRFDSILQRGLFGYQASER